MESTLSKRNFENNKNKKIRYPKNLIQNSLGYGILMIGVGLFAVYINTSSPFSYLWILVGLLQIGISQYHKKHQYLTIADDKLIKHTFFPKSIEVSKIHRVRKYVNSYRIETSEKSLRIEKDLIEKESLQELKQFLDSLSFRVEQQQAETTN